MCDPARLLLGISLYEVISGSCDKPPIEYQCSEKTQEGTEHKRAAFVQPVPGCAPTVGGHLVLYRGGDPPPDSGSLCYFEAGGCFQRDWEMGGDVGAYI